ncbi:MAG: hypothetical protein HC930_06670 [Hydrococcus sp. SU_1_0]|nr:hypothetical protein [Hydrococcus sp. SU_1_0]
MAWEITPEELLVRYDDGERNFAGIKLIYSYGALLIMLESISKELFCETSI